MRACVLIAGWHGQIVHALVELAAKDPSITALSVGRPVLDLCTPSSIRSTFIAAQPDVMINTAACTAVDQAESDPAAAFDLNCKGAAAFAELARRNDTPIIHLSRDYVFDGTKKGAYTEADKLLPRTVYGRSKLEGESAVAAANPMHQILRTSRVFSPFGRNFVTNLLTRARERIEVVGDQRGCPTYALDFAHVILELASRIASERQAVAWGTCHAVGTGAASWYEFAQKALEISRAQGGADAELAAIRAKGYATEAPRLANVCLDSSKLSNACGLGRRALPIVSNGWLKPVQRRTPATPTDLYFITSISLPRKWRDSLTIWAAAASLSG